MQEGVVEFCVCIRIFLSACVVFCVVMTNKMVFLCVDKYILSLCWNNVLCILIDDVFYFPMCFYVFLCVCGIPLVCAWCDSFNNRGWIFTTFSTLPYGNEL